MWDGLFDKDENIEKNPLYYHGTLGLEKANKELKRSLNAMHKAKVAEALAEHVKTGE